MSAFETYGAGDFDFTNMKYLDANPSTGYGDMQLSTSSSNKYLGQTIDISSVYAGDGDSASPSTEAVVPSN